MPSRFQPAAALLALAVSGCALAGAAAPSVSVIDVHLVGLGLTEQQLGVTLCVTNPNKTALEFKRVMADLDVAGAPLAAGQSELPVQLPPLSSTPVPFQVVTAVQNLRPQLLGVLNTGSVEYRVHGTVALTGALGITVPFSRSGRLNVVADSLQWVSTAGDPARDAPPGCSISPYDAGRRPMPPNQTPL